jgi:hypothetical protein
MTEETPMGWSEHRIEEYRQGQHATWLERRMLEHAKPVHFPMALVATAGFIYGLWTHDWLWIIGSSALALLGHVYCWTRKNSEKRHETKLPERGRATVSAR